jgi:tRNA modification GTPase
MEKSEAHSTFARLTPPGSAGVATLRLDGEDVWEILRARIRENRKESDRAWHSETKMFRYVRVNSFSEKTALWEQVVLYLPNPKAVEIHCHGGTAVLSSLENALQEDALAGISWQSWCRRQASPLLKAEARVALARARTEKTAFLLFDQYRGALADAIREIRRLIEEKQKHAARQRLDSLLEWSRVGRHLTQPFRVAIVGKPNVGKSSLLNAILGYRRAIVDTTPGTTRDLVTATTVLEGWPVECIDSAGIRDSENAMERIGIRRIQEWSERVDAIVWVHDVSSTESSRESQRGPSCGGDALPLPTIFLYNKIDRLSAKEREDVPPSGVSVSALTGEGIPEFLNTLREKLVPKEPERGQPLPFTESQIVFLERLREALTTGEDVRSRFEEILGPHCEETL